MKKLLLLIFLSSCSQMKHREIEINYRDGSIDTIYQYVNQNYEIGIKGQCLYIAPDTEVACDVKSFSIIK